MNRKSTLYLYFISSSIVILLMAIAGVYDISGQKDVVHYTVRLGYPIYFIIWLGFCKLLGVICILIPGARKLREWCYAGFTIDLTSAIVSHYCCNDPIPIIMLPVLGLIILLLSYFSYVRLLKFKYQL